MSSTTTSKNPYMGKPNIFVTDRKVRGFFDRTAYRRRNLIERVVGWYKEYRALGTRYEKLAVNYVVLWIIAFIEKLLRKYAQKLQTGLSERA